MSLTDDLTEKPEIPDLDLGEPEMVRPEHSTTPDSEKRVIVDADATEVESHHGEEENMTEEELEKHKQFEAMRRKHYEMKNVKNLLGYVHNTSLLECSF